MNKPITVVQCYGGCPKSPTSKWQRSLAVIQRCHEQGWRTYLVWYSMPENPELVDPFRKAGCEIVIQPRSHREFDPASVLRYGRLLRHLRCDVFHCDNDHTSPLIGALLAGVPVRIWSKLSMSPYYEEGVSPRGVHRLMLSTRISCLCSSRVFAISNRVRQELIESVGFGHRIDTVYVPVDHDRLALAARGEIRREVGLCPSDTVITTVGHAVPLKGWDIAIRALARVRSRFQNVHLVLVGSTTAHRETAFCRSLTSLARESNVSDSIHFTGYRHDIPEILKASDVFILPSRSDGLCCALIEAMASGLPCVAARVGGIPEVITHGEDGLLFARENVEELAGHIIRLIEDKSLRERLAARASKRSNSFSVKVYADRVFAAYRLLLTNHSARAASLASTRI